MILKMYSIATSFPNCAWSLSPMNFSDLLKPVVGGAVSAHSNPEWLAHFHLPVTALSILLRAIWPSRTGVIDFDP
jgi:hypothetical protein